ncbi:GxGYxYP domain-containing protein [Bacillus sp. FJAT-26390]|uniref:GxGYxYP domain-containing protein n=1 Tax=Bacillus sp. FJAT-26390 TaxID=1743142 RepID=UPI000807B1C6|nr:GxGYxYP domain-containing protein [Bacillus sp. FJAT-26390]OBZ09494.1 hypothetical protein A7975_25745 [Bacillus sp. FJAT-26390]
MMKLAKWLGIAIFVLILAGCSGANAKTFSYFPKIEAPEHLYVIQKSSLSPEELVLVGTLQGVLAQDKPEIYITDDAYDDWLEELRAKHGVKTEEVKDAWTLMEKFKDRIQGFYAYENNTPSVNVATSLAGLKQAVAAEKALSSKMESIGLKQLEDVSDKDDMWLFKQYGDQFNKDIIVQLHPERGELRDYGVALKAMYIYDSVNDEELPEIYKSLNPDAIRLGWGKGSESEHIAPASLQGVAAIPSDWAMNLTALSAVKPQKAFKQPYHVKAGEADARAHYVSFVMSDGDNVQWLLNDFVKNNKYYGSSERGQFPMGWQMAPTLADLAPDALSLIYEKAKKDHFVVAVSGTGYFFPSEYPEEALKENVKRLDAYMKKTDMQLAVLLDWNSPEKASIEQFASVPSLKGGILAYGEKYVGGAGKVWWAKDKPFVSVRETLWDADPVKMAERINGYTTDPTKEEGYTIINVHPWSRTMSDVRSVIDHLDAHVKVVSPEELFDRIVRDVKARTPLAE